MDIGGDLSWDLNSIPLFSKKNIEEKSGKGWQYLKVTHDRTDLKVGGNLSSQSTGDQTFTGVKMDIGGKTHLNSKEGQISFKIDKDIDSYSETRTRKNLLFIKTKNKGHHHEKLNPCEILGEGGMIVESKKGVYVEVPKGELGNNERTKWMLELRQNPTVMWQEITEQHKNWNRTQRTLTPAAAGILGLGISLVTSGWGASLLSLGGVAGKIASTALTNIMSRASISLINNQGDLGKVFKELSSSKSLRSFAVMLASAGITGIVGLPTEAQGFEQHLKSNLISTGVSTSLSVIIEGKDPKEALGEALRTITAHTLGGMIANEIGGSYHDGKINGFEQKVSHLLLGGGMGAILSKDPFKGILPGALGSVAAECLAEMLSPDNVDSVVSRVSAKTQGRNLSDKKLMQLYKQELRTYREEIKTSAKWAKFGAGVIALSTGQDVDIAIETAKNSVENNFVLPLIIGALTEISVESLFVLAGRLYFGARIFNTVETQRQLREDEVNEKEDREENIGGEEPNQPENEGGDEEKNPKPKGVNNPKTKESLEYGNKRHDEFKKENENIHINPKNSKHRPDLNTENAVHELKPGTVTGVKKGLPQLKRYEKVYKKDGLMHLYQPKNGPIDLNRIVEKNFKKDPLVQKIIENIKNDK